MKKLLLLSILVSGTVYNTDNYMIRLLFLSLFSLSFPCFIFYGNILKKSLIELLYSLLIILGCFICIFINIGSFKANVVGPAAEMFSIFVYFFGASLLVFYTSLSTEYISKNGEKIIFYYFKIIMVFLIIDALVRYFAYPQCYMSYSCRFYSKNEGFFINSNITGQITASLLILTIFIKLKYKRIIQTLLFVFLIMSMARSAVVAFLVTYICTYLFTMKGYKKYIIFFIGFIIIVSLVIIDPLNFRHDGSGLSKVHFVLSVLNIIKTADWINILFGFGASYKTIVALLNVGHWSPHLSILKSFLYYGLFGVLSFIFILYRMYKWDHRMLYPIICFLIFGLAGAPIYWPTLSVILIILLIDKKVSQINSIKLIEGRL